VLRDIFFIYEVCDPQSDVWSDPDTEFGAQLLSSESGHDPKERELHSLSFDE